MFRKDRVGASGLLQCISALPFQALLLVISPSGRNMDWISSNIFMKSVYCISRNTCILKEKSRIKIEVLKVDISDFDTRVGKGFWPHLFWPRGGLVFFYLCSNMCHLEPNFKVPASDSMQLFQDFLVYPFFKIHSLYQGEPRFQYWKYKKYLKIVGNCFIVCLKNHSCCLFFYILPLLSPASSAILKMKEIKSTTFSNQGPWNSRQPAAG